MEELFLLPGSASISVQRAGSCGFLRSNSTWGNLSTHESEELLSDSSECGATASCHRIAMAKRILAEATRTFIPCVSPNAAKSDQCRNTGALGPLLCMVQSENEVDALRRSLDTLAFLLLDKANRQVVGELGGVDILLSLLQRHAGPDADATLQRLALDCLCNMVKSDDKEKEYVWQHPAKGAVLALIHPRTPSAHLAEVLGLVRKMMFKGTQQGRCIELLEPQLLTALADVLHVGQPTAVSVRVCKLLRTCADCAGHEHAPMWHNVLYRIVPLLRDHSSVELALPILVSLSEHMAFKNMFATTGGIQALLPLVSHRSTSVAVNGACIIGSLSEVGLSRDALCSQQSLEAMLRALSSSEHPDVCVALVYALSNLVKYSSKVTTMLVQYNTPAMLHSLVPSWLDAELVLGAEQLIAALTAAQVTQHMQHAQQQPGMILVNCTDAVAASSLHQDHEDEVMMGGSDHDVSFGHHEHVVPVAFGATTGSGFVMGQCGHTDQKHQHHHFLDAHMHAHHQQHGQHSAAPFAPQQSEPMSMCPSDRSSTFLLSAIPTLSMCMDLAEDVVVPDALQQTHSHQQEQHQAVPDVRQRPTTDGDITHHTRQLSNASSASTFCEDDRVSSPLPDSLFVKKPRFSGTDGSGMTKSSSMSCFPSVHAPSGSLHDKGRIQKRVFGSANCLVEAASTGSPRVQQSVA